MTSRQEKNHWLAGESIKDYLVEYGSQLQAAMAALPSEGLDQFHRLLLETVKNGRRIYVGGNGGSAAIADHLCCDFTKGTHAAGHPTLRTHSLSANTALLTALSNDFSYDEAFSKQLQMLGEAGDAVILISSSGNSPNVLAAAQTARAIGMKILAMVGFSGGKLPALADASLHVRASNYGLVEDAHQAIMHVLSQWIARDRESR